jgi:hypothetical protein
MSTAGIAGSRYWAILKCGVARVRASGLVYGAINTAN